VKQRRSPCDKLKFFLLFRCMHEPASTASSRWLTDVKARHSPHGWGGGHDRWCVTETTLSINSRLQSAMQVSYSKPAVMAGRRWEARRHTIGYCHVALYTVWNCVFWWQEKILYLWSTYKSLPKFLGQDFVVNFATYMCDSPCRWFEVISQIVTFPDGFFPRNSFPG